MDFKKLFEVQKELDAHIEKEHPREQGEDRLGKKILSLLVELGECANETRCFKYWSYKPASEKAVILEEYVDCLHFILSIGLELKYTDFEVWKMQAEKTIENQFNETFSSGTSLYFQHRLGFVPKIIYEGAVAHFITLGEMLGFIWEQIEEAYLAKNKINHERQNHGY